MAEQHKNLSLKKKKKSDFTQEQKMTILLTMEGSPGYNLHKEKVRKL
jgi:hypothetical protein